MLLFMLFFMISVCVCSGKEKLRRKKYRFISYLNFLTYLERDVLKAPYLQIKVNSEELVAVVAVVVVVQVQREMPKLETFQTNKTEVWKKQDENKVIKLP